MKQSLLQSFGIDKLGYFRSPTTQRFHKDIAAAINQNDMIAIAGGVGTGKTELFKDVRRKYALHPDTEPIFVYIRNFNKDRLNISGIMWEFINAVSAESPKRDSGARSLQFIRLAGDLVVNQNRKVCIVIEESHRLHYNTLRSLKELREAEFNGITPLFSVVLIGHPELAIKLEKRKEVYWRSTLLTLNEASGWMNFSERVLYLQSRFGDAITPGAREKIAALNRVPLQMDVFVKKCMIEAHAAGLDKLTEECIEVSLSAIKEALEVSLADIANEAGIGKTTVSDVLNNRGTKKSTEAVKGALDRLRNRKANQGRMAV